MTSGQRGRRRLSDDERVLWKEVTRSIVPLRTIVDESPQAHAPSEQHSAETSTKTSAKTDAPPEFRVTPKSSRGDKAPLEAVRPAQSIPKAPPMTPLAPLGRRLKQSLGRGAESIDGRLDLHGLTQAQAHVALARFLFDAQARGAKTVLVITGKGRSDASGERGVLARQVPHWLRMADMRTCVIGFENAHRAHGGEGALYIRVRRVR